MPTTLRLRPRRICSCVLYAAVILIAVLVPQRTFAQSESASLSGRVTDQSNAVVPGVEVELKNADTGVSQLAKTNDDGLYSFPFVKPGNYVMSVRKQSFQTVSVTGMTLNVQDNLSRNFVLRVGSSAESVTVNASDLRMNTTDAAVGTVVDRQFVEHIPLNGRSFQSLMTLAPGVAVVTSYALGTGGGGVGDAGEITVNGQRTEANYFTVDGVSANTGSAPGPNSFIGGGISGGTPGETIMGTTQSIVSIDALQEFRATTSTYSAEYGRTPGGQFAFTTRSGTNDWHGSAYDYFRNEVLDGNNWFNNSANPQVPRLPERQNDFGGTLGGPIVVPGLYNGKGKTFFFFSYEGLRLTVPTPFQQLSVPDVALRQQAPAALQPFLNAFPLPSKDGSGNYIEDGRNDGLGLFNQLYSSPSSLDNVGIRVDHDFGDKLRIFGRYADTPSSAWNYAFPAIKQTNEINVRTLTVGATSSISPTQANELRFNVTQNNIISSNTSTSFGGAVPLDFSNLAAPNGQRATPQNTAMEFLLLYGGAFVFVGDNQNSQRQYNLTDTYSWSRGAHQFKFGLDWRRLTTFVRPINNQQVVLFFDEASVLANNAGLAGAVSLTESPVEPVYHNFSTFVQDEWKATPRLSLSLGLRWDINPAPGNLSGPSPYTVDQITDLVTTKLARRNTPLWNTDWHGFAPRAGVAYQMRQASGHETVLRTGFGMFYDMGNTQGSQGFQSGIGFLAVQSYSNVPFPLTSAQVALPAPSIAPPYQAYVYAFDPDLKLPYTMQWNLAIEQALGTHQSLTVGYVGSASRKLLAQFNYSPESLGNPNFSAQMCAACLYVTSNRASSGYNALQVKYQKNLSHGLQALASYTWSHSIDDASSNFFVLDELLRSSSDFDIRHNFQAAITYDIPGSYANPVASAVLKHWGLDTRISARSALPVDLIGAHTVNPVTQQSVFFHPDLVLGEPLYLRDSQYAGGRIINPHAFELAPDGVEGDTPRNFARGFGAVQADLALRRDFPIHERLRLQFRAEAFNLFNHASFGAIHNRLQDDGPDRFGRAYSTLNSSLGGLNPLYQVGGPRSLQLMLKLAF